MIHTARVSTSQCQSCGHVGEPTSKFCGGCGTPLVPLANQVTAPNTYHQPNQQAYSAPAYRPQQQVAAPNAYVPPPRQDGFTMPPPPGTQVITEVLPAGVPGNPARPSVPVADRNVPAFAHVKAPVTADVSNELKQEAAKLYLLLARERLFLIFHWGTFIGLNLLGCWLGLKCYFEFFGDEMSKIMMASTPFLFINSVALCCLVSIKGTRGEIERLKERTQYIKFKMEFGHLM